MTPCYRLEPCFEPKLPKFTSMESTTEQDLRLTLSEKPVAFQIKLNKYSLPCRRQENISEYGQQLSIINTIRDQKDQKNG